MGRDSWRVSRDELGAGVWQDTDGDGWGLPISRGRARRGGHWKGVGKPSSQWLGHWPPTPGLWPGGGQRGHRCRQMGSCSGQCPSWRARCHTWEKGQPKGCFRFRYEGQPGSQSLGDPGSQVWEEVRTHEEQLGAS